MRSLIRILAKVVGKKRPGKAEKQFASAVRFPDRIVLHSYLQTPYGHFAAEPFRVVGLDASAEVVAAAVLEVLNASRRADDTPHGKEFGKWSLEQMGVKSQAQLQRGTLSVGIVQSEGMMAFSATHNGGTSGDGKGFRPNGSAAVAVAVGAPAEEVAGALRKAFELCTSVYA